MMNLRVGRSLEEYLDAAWLYREAEKPRQAKSTGAWPFRRASDESNIVKFPNGSHWHLGDGVWHP